MPANSTHTRGIKAVFSIAIATTSAALAAQPASPQTTSSVPDPHEIHIPATIDPPIMPAHPCVQLRDWMSNTVPQGSVVKWEDENVVIRVPVAGKYPSALDPIRQVERRLKGALMCDVGVWDGGGYYEGNPYGPGTYVIEFAVADANEAVAALAPILKVWPALKGGTVIKQYASHRLDPNGLDQSVIKY